MARLNLRRKPIGDNQETRARRAQETAFQAYLARMAKLLSKTGRNAPVLKIERGNALQLRALTMRHPPRGNCRGSAPQPHPPGALNDGARRAAQERTLALLSHLDGEYKRQLLCFLHREGLIAKEAVIALNGADLSKVDLSEADLWGINLLEANLRYADLSGADLSGADLSGSTLAGADLSLANLRWANVADEQLAQASSLAGAFLPNGTRHP